jgi:hypothetical protein
MAERPQTIAIIALCLSIGTASFSVYQWWRAQRESIINASIEVTRNYIRQSDHDRAPATLRSMNTPGVAIAVKPPDWEIVRRYMAELEYIAFLLNESRLNEDFVAPSIIFDIKCNYELLAEVQRDKVWQLSSEQMKKFVDARPREKFVGEPVG